MAEEKKIGVVTHFFPKVGAGIIKLTEGDLKVGDKIHIKGHSTDFEQVIESMQIEHAPIQAAKIGAEIGVKVSEPVREHDVVYKVLG